MERDGRQRVVITVRPNPSDGDRLKVADAMRQVLDVLRVLESAGRSLEADPKRGFDWRLERATANSPFTVVAVADARDPAIDVSQRVRLAKHETAIAFRAVAERRSPPAWLDPDGTAALRSVYERTLNGIAATAIDFDADGRPDEKVTGQVDVAPETAGAALAALRDAAPLSEMRSPARVAHGELDGRLAAVGRYRGQPALQVVNRLYGPVWCVVPSELADRLGDERTLREVWSGRRVAVSGRLHYAAGGRLVRVVVEDIRERPSRHVRIEDVLDADFTAGLDPIEYLDRLHDGSLA